MATRSVNSALDYQLVHYSEIHHSDLESHVRCLREQKKKDEIGGTARIVAESVAATLSLVAIPMMVKGFKISERLDQVEAFELNAQERKAPKSSEKIKFKTKHRTFNYINEYALENGIVWCRRRNSRLEWKPIYSYVVDPVQIDADGANLILIDKTNTVAYKKVLKEYRHDQVPKKYKTTVETGSFLVVDQSFRNKWREGWFRFPVVHHLVNMVAKETLQLQGAPRSVCISHRGKYNNFIEDKVGNIHNVDSTTTLYVLEESGRDIIKFDPHSPTWAMTKIHLPDTDKTVFEALKISVSASTIMAIGYEINVQTKAQKLKVITRLADMDTEGWNPTFKYDYFADSADSDVHILPIDDEWTDHEIPEEYEVSQLITIDQCGRGNKARNLYMKARDKSGRWGVLEKALTDKRWVFVCDEGEVEEIVDKEIMSTFVPKSSVKCYTGELDTDGYTIDGVLLEQFGLRSHHAKIRIASSKDNEEYVLDLYRRVDPMTFIGVEKKRYDLVVPEKYHGAKELQSLIGKLSFQEVEVSENDHGLVIQSLRTGDTEFKFVFGNP